MFVHVVFIVLLGEKSSGIVSALDCFAVSVGVILYPTLSLAQSSSVQNSQLGLDDQAGLNNQSGLDVTMLHSDSIVLTEHVAFYEDPTAELTLEDVIQPHIADLFILEQSSSPAFNFNSTSATVWFRLTLLNTSKTSIERFLEIAFTELSKVNFYVLNKGRVHQSIETGLSKPFSTRGRENRFFVFPINVPPEDSLEIYISVSSKSELIAPLILWEKEAFHNYELIDYMLQAAFFSIVIGLTYFNTLLYITLRNVSCLQYIAYLISFSLFLGSSGGLSHQYLWPSATWWANNAAHFFAIITSLTFMIFVRRQLNTHDNFHKIHVLTNVLILASPCLILLIILVPFYVSNFVQAYVLFSLLLLLTATVLRVRERQRNAYYILFAICSLMISIVVYALQVQGLLPNNVFTISSVQIGASFEMLIMMMMLVDTFNQLRKEKEKTQFSLISVQEESLFSQEQLLLNLKHNETELEEKVQQRTQALESAFKTNNDILLHSPLPMFLADLAGRCLEANQAAAELIGGSREQILGMDLKSNNAWRESGLSDELHRALATNRQTQCEIKLVTRFGKSLWLDVYLLPIKLKEEVQVLIQCMDLTSRKQDEEKLKALAFYDGLTNLANRRLLLDRLDHAITKGQRNNHYGAVLYLDLNKFKLLNDTYGHDVGDKLLTEVANRLTKASRKSDTVARLGGDEFVVLLEGVADNEALAQQYANNAADKLRNVLSEAYFIGDIMHSSSASVGVTLFYGASCDADKILKEADMSMYEAKRLNKA